MQKKKNPA